MMKYNEESCMQFYVSAVHRQTTHSSSNRVNRSIGSGVCASFTAGECFLAVVCSEMHKAKCYIEQGTGDKLREGLLPATNLWDGSV